MTRWEGPQGYWVSDETSFIDVPYVHHWLATESYWAKGRQPEVTEAAVAHSINLGLYDKGGAQVGFCRWVTDEATFAWLCDVFVDAAHRGRRLGVFLVEVARAHPVVRDLRMLLGTADAHELYRKTGFTALAAPERYMEIRKDGIPPAP